MCWPQLSVQAASFSNCPSKSKSYLLWNFSVSRFSRPCYSVVPQFNLYDSKSLTCYNQWLKEDCSNKASIIFPFKLLNLLFREILRFIGPFLSLNFPVFQTLEVFKNLTILSRRVPLRLSQSKMVQHSSVNQAAIKSTEKIRFP